MNSELLRIIEAIHLEKDIPKMQPIGPNAPQPAGVRPRNP